MFALEWVLVATGSIFSSLEPPPTAAWSTWIRQLSAERLVTSCFPRILRTTFLRMRTWLASGLYGRHSYLSAPHPFAGKDLRPASQTCEQCQWPRRSTGDKLLVR